MSKRRFPLVLLVFFVCALPVPAHAAILDFVSDLISNSIPSNPATNQVQFTVPQAIPASGKISIDFEEGAFTIPGSFDYTDVDLAVWNGSSYVDRDLAASPSGSEDGVAVVTGTSGRITFTLSSSLGIAAGSKVQVRLGTSATFGAQGAISIQNPPGQRSYRITINTYSDTNTALDIGWAMIAILQPVTLNLPLRNIPPTLSDGLPSGLLAAGNKVIEVTFATDRTATCRYSTIANTPYASMTNSFDSIAGTFFFTVISGFQDNTDYTFYVRCRGIQGAINTDDYPISFSLAPTPISDTSVTQSGGIVGTGPFPNGSSVLYQSVVSLAGLTAPGSTVVVLKDGVQTLTTQADAQGAFHAVVSNLERGTYTFSVYSIDSQQKKSASYSSTISVGAGTSNTVSGITLPPTVQMDKDTFAIGEKVSLHGASAPGGTVEVSLMSLSGTASQYTASTTGGVWQLAIDGSAVQAGSYTVKVRTILATTQSDFSTPVFFGVGQKPSPNLLNRSDINRDGKVNLVDFSILLSFWGTGNASADINADGIVNLADFSIMLFNWTG